MPLHAEHEAAVVALDPLDGPVGRPGDRPQAVAEPLDGLVVEGVHAQRAGADGAREQRAGFDRHVVRDGPAGLRLAVVGHVLEERAAARDVERLGAAADAEDRQAAGVGMARDRQLEGVHVGLHRAELGVRLGAVGGRVDVRAAGQADAGQRLQQRGHQLQRQRRQHHRDRPGARERAHVGHAERQLGLRRLALGRRVGEQRAPHLGGRDADQRGSGHRAQQGDKRVSRRAGSAAPGSAPAAACRGPAGSRARACRRARRPGPRARAGPSRGPRRPRRRRRRRPRR